MDDCFVPWTKSEEELIKFHSVLNNLHNDIRFTLEYDQNEQPFLDVMVRNKGGKIETDISIKKQTANSICCSLLVIRGIQK